LSLLTNKNIQAYAMIPKVHGMGKTGTAFGSFTSQGESSSVLLTVADASDDRGVSGASIPTLPIPAGSSNSHETDGDALRGDHLTRRMDPATSPLVVPVEDSHIS
jgi:hypothetical protein